MPDGGVPVCSRALAGSSVKSLFGASNDTGNEVLDVFSSSDGGATWARGNGPQVGEGCAQGSPKAASLPGGGELLAFLGAPECGNIQSLTPFLVVTTRAGSSGHWSPIVHVAKPANAVESVAEVLKSKTGT